MDNRAARGAGGVEGAARGTVEVNEAADEVATLGQAIGPPRVLGWSDRLYSWSDRQLLF
jgi:hypothetical protein